MIKPNKNILLALAIICFSNFAYAGPTAAPVETAIVKIQVGLQKISTALSKLTKEKLQEEIQSIGAPNTLTKLDKNVKNKTLVAAEDATPITPPYLNSLLDADKPNVPNMHTLVKKNAPIDYKTIYTEDKTDITLKEIGLGTNPIIKNTSAEDALIPNSQEAMQLTYHMSLEQARAIAQKSFALMENSADYKASRRSDNEKRETTVSIEKGNALANHNSTVIINEFGILRFSGLEIYSLEEMQDKSISTLK